MVVGSNPTGPSSFFDMAKVGFEPPKGLENGIFQVVGVTGSNAAARGAEPLWKFALANLGSRPKAGILLSPEGV
ncbi:MAG: hypothetical protein ACYSUK_00765 [Planctomycetota bacterium]